MAYGIDRVDGLSSRVAQKGACRVATTANITLAGEQTIDTVAVVTGDRVLVKNQSTAADNGIYVCDTGAWGRAKDFSRNDDVKTGTKVLVTAGASNGGSEWYVQTTGAIEIGVSALSFATLSQTFSDGSVTVPKLATDVTDLIAEPKEPDVTIPVTLLATNGSTRSLRDRAGDIVSVMDYSGATFTARLKNALADTPAAVIIPAGSYPITETIIVPPGTRIVGQGRYDNWGGTAGLGTVLYTSGAGTASRWTDITGSDASDDIPMFVAGGNGVYFEQITLRTGVDAYSWTMGVLFPCVKQCGVIGFQAHGFTDGCLYLDATWSDRNTTLAGLHPEITSSTGMNEFSAFDFWLTAAGTAGFAIKIQGTTRAGNAVGSSTDWLWGWGGTSDIRFVHGRLGATGASGGCFSHDAQLYGVGVYGQGVTVRDTSFRLSASGRYLAKYDRSNRVIIDGAYGESTGGTTPEVAVTTRTQSATDGIQHINDKLNGDVTLDGSVVGSGSTVPWEATRCLTVQRVNGARWYTPNLLLPGKGTTEVPLFKSFYTAGRIRFSYDNGSTVSDYLRFDNAVVWPEITNAIDLGGTSNRWKKAWSVDADVSGTAAIAKLSTPGWTTLTIASDTITVTASAHRVDTEAAAATDNLSTINGGVDGMRLLLRTQTSARDVTLVDGAGNLQIAGNFTLATSSDLIELVYDASTSLWYEVGRSTNA